MDMLGCCLELAGYSVYYAAQERYTIATITEFLTFD
jgi:hypothetical protein